MHILVISDTHGKEKYIREALENQNTVPRALFFLGDGLRDLRDMPTDGMDVYKVRGNCDWSFDQDVPTERLVRFGSYTFLLMHGHEHGVKYGTEAAIHHALSRGADAVLFGHTHERAEILLPAGAEFDGKRLERPFYAFNPGSLGFFRSFGTITVQKDGLLFGFGEVAW